jgi:hypothetical protein
MSRTIKGSKGPGYEYWGREANVGKWANQPGKFSKRLAARRRRRANKIK